MSGIETLWQEARAHMQAGRMRAAEHCLRRVVALDDTHAAIWQALGTVLLCGGRAKEAVGAFEQAVTADPMNRFHILHLAAAVFAADPADANAAAMAGFALAGLPTDKRQALLAQAGDLVAPVAANAAAGKQEPDFVFLPVPYAAACQSAQLQQQAERMLTSGDLQQAYAAFREAIRLNAHNKRALSRTADTAFETGEIQAGLGHLRALAALSPDRAPLLYRLAVIEEQVGDAAHARAAYLACLKAGPRNALAFLFAGAFFESGGDTETAAMLYSLGEDIDARLRQWHRDPGFDAETRRRSAAADKLLRTVLTDVHRQALAPLPAGRVAAAVWRRTAPEPATPPLPNQQPHLFYIPDLPPYSFVERTQLPWASAFEAAFADIKAEFAAALPQIEPAGRPYLAADMELGAAFDAIKGSLNWSALDLYRDGRPNQAVLRHFPKLLAALEAVPLVRIGDHPFELFFSLLKPRQHIPPHFGLSNHGITVHLPLIVPEGCRFRAGDEWREWQEGRLLAFDDSFDHEARNDSDALRVVLIFEVWHPGLTDDEIAAVRATFAARDAWQAARRIPEK